MTKDDEDDEFTRIEMEQRMRQAWTPNDMAYRPNGLSQPAQGIRPVESDYLSHVAYTRALEVYCDNLEKPAQEPEEFRHIGDRDCLFDVDELAWRSIVENRGGCRCHISPPCNACVDPIEEEELNDVGYTYTTPPAAQPVQEPILQEQLEKARADLKKARADVDKALADLKKARADRHKARADWGKARAGVDKALADWHKALADWDKARDDWDKAYADVDKALADWDKALAEVARIKKLIEEQK